MPQNLPPAGDPYWVAKAITAVAAFDPDLERVGIAHLLSMWKFADRLTVDQTRQVVEHFTTTTVELGRVIPPYDQPAGGAS